MHDVLAAWACQSCLSACVRPTHCCAQAPAEQEQQAALSLQCSSEQQAQQLAAALQQAAAGQPPQAQQQAQPGGGSSEGGNRFDSKTDKASADLYFHYYGMLQHQQNMLQVRALVCCSSSGSLCMRTRAHVARVQP